FMAVPQSNTEGARQIRLEGVQPTLTDGAGQAKTEDARRIQTEAPRTRSDGAARTQSDPLRSHDYGTRTSFDGVSQTQTEAPPTRTEADASPLTIVKARDTVKTRESSNAIFELGCLLFLVVTIEWLVPFARDPRLAYQGLAFLILILLFVCQVRDGFNLRDVGLRADNFGRVLSRILLPCVVFIVAVILIGWNLGSLRFGQKFYSMWLSVPMWALLQQYMLLAFAMPRLKKIVRGRNYVLATAALFSIFHLPNPVLAIVC